MLRCSGPWRPARRPYPSGTLLASKTTPAWHVFLSSRHQRPFGTWSIYSDPTRRRMSLVLPAGFDWPALGGEICPSDEGSINC